MQAAQIQARINKHFGPTSAYEKQLKRVEQLERQLAAERAKLEPLAADRQRIEAFFAALEPVVVAPAAKTAKPAAKKK
jgi:cell division protein FtsB